MAGTTVPADRRILNCESDQETRVLVGLGERNQSPRDVVVADQVENHFINSAFAAVHFAHLLSYLIAFRAFLPDNARCRPILYQLSI